MVKPINAPWELSYKDLQFERSPITMPVLSGLKYTRWVDIGMPKISPALLDCVFFLYKTREDAEMGKKSGGTGFFVGIPSEKFPQEKYVYAVTNWHNVLQNGYSIIRVNNVAGSVSIIETEPAEWEFMPRKDDIAVMPIPVGNNDYKIILIPTTMFVTEDVVNSMGLGVGDDVFMVGRFIDYDGEITNQPAVRFGNISIMSASIKQEATGYMGKSHCIDLHSRAGFSGSPVFVYRTPGTNFDNKMVDLGERFQYLLGIHWGQFPEEWKIIMKDKLPNAESHTLITEGEYVKDLSGMTCVIPAQKILDVLYMPSLKRQRIEGDIETMDNYKRNGFPPEVESTGILESKNPQHKEDFNSLVSAAAKKKPQADET